MARSSAAPAVVSQPQAEGVSWLDQRRAKSPDAKPAPLVKPAEPMAPPPPPEPDVDTSMAPAVMDVWKSVVGAVEGSLVPVLKGAVPLEVTGAAVRIAIDDRDSFFKRKLATPEAQEVIAEAASRIFGVRPTVTLVQGTLPDGSLSIARLEENLRNEERRRREEALRANPLVLAVCEVLGGDVQRVRLDGDPV